MAKNHLTVEQDILTRRFYQEVALKADAHFPGSPSSARKLRGLVLDLLGYQVLPNGARISKGIEVQHKYGNPDFSAYPDEWNSDIQRIRQEVTGGTRNRKSTPKASTSEPSESTPVGEGVLSKDVQ